MKKQFPILEFDSDRGAIISPSDLVKEIPDIPKHAVVCFFNDVITHLAESGKLKIISKIKSEMGFHFVYSYEFENRSIVLFHPGVGAPLAVATFEDVIQMGCNKFIVCGGAGVLDKEIAAGNLIVPNSAIRDEGTSYHYLEPSREVAPSSEALIAIETTLTKRNISYRIGKTWTTDGVYRETSSKISLRKSEGCIAVEMEAAALFAVAKFRGVKIGQILYGGDNVDTEIWDHRDWQSNWDIREMLVALSAEACLLL
ncbi:MAG: nucleoside phosphorylase [Melioribacteraceae bacterium]|nr:nucleoside phosphorylase [Melioribacteraceae bacterium]